jgi:hypothetical protein
VTEKAREALLDVRLVMALALQHEQVDWRDTPLAAEPLEIVENDRAVIFAYEDIVYGIVRDAGGDTRFDLLYEDLREVRVCRAFDRSGRLIDLDELRNLAARAERLR